jgi:hypothetical protein
MADAVTLSFGSRRCPLCGSEEVLRSRRRGLIELFFVPLFLLRPYRCRQCSARHLGFILRPRVVAIPGDERYEH